MEKTNKKLAIVSILLAVIITGIGVSFGYFLWNSANNTDISFTVEGAVVELSDGADIKGASLMPVINYTTGGSDVVKKDIKIKLKNNVTSDVTVDFKLKINSIDSGLKHSSFKYNLVNASGTSISSGDFATSKAGDSISLLSLSSTNGTLTTSLTGYTLYIYIDGTVDNPSSMMNQSFDFSFVVDGSNSTVEHISAVKKVESLDDGSTGDSGSGVYKVTHSAIPASSSATGSEIPAVTDYRYYGPNPNNYICLDKEGASTCPDKHLYRIIGSIYEELEGTNRLKVIKATPLKNDSTTKYARDSGSSNIWATITNGNYSNSLTSGASLMKLLNSGDWWNRTNTYANYGLTEKTKSYITTSRYYLGGYDNSPPITTTMYEYEREKARCDNKRPLYWDGYVGLMYPSDYGYAAGNTCAKVTRLIDYEGGCMNKDWLYISGTEQWLMSPSSGYAGDAFGVFSDGLVTYGMDAGNVCSARPTFFLNSSVSITSGTGTSTDPYLVTK